MINAFNATKTATAQCQPTTITTQHGLHSSFIALLAGGLLTLAFAPANAYLLAPVCLAVLFKLWELASPKQAFVLGFWWGVGLFGIGISWVYISLTQFGGMMPLLAVVVLVGLISLLALFPAGVGFLATTFAPAAPTTSLSKRHLIVLPCLWVLSEWLRSHIAGGFPWLLVGYTATSHPLLKGYAPVIGVFGLSLLSVFIAGLLLIVTQKPRSYRKLLTALITCLLLGAGNKLLLATHWTQATQASLPVTLLQGNISQDTKWNREKISMILSTYDKLVKQNTNPNSLVIMPEAAIPLLETDASPYLAQLRAYIQQQHSALITGIPLTDAASQHYYNGLLALGQAQGHYYKHHLVPFGEYIPLEYYLKKWVNRLITIPLSSLTAGPAYQAPITVWGIRIAPFICYEIAYADQVTQSQKNTQLLLVLTDDSWFGASWAAAQHLQIAQMRALENGRFLLFSSNNGITAVINPHGEIIKQLPPFTRAYLKATLHPMKGATPLTLWGSELSLLTSLIMLGGALFL